MKPFYLRALLLLLVAVWLAGCADTMDSTASDSAVKTSGTVPGEKAGDEPMSATGGPGGVGAGMRW